MVSTRVCGTLRSGSNPDRHTKYNMKNSESKTERPEIILSRDLTFIQTAIELQNKVFGPQPENSPYNNKDEWIKRVSNGGYFVVARDAQGVKGFAVCDITREKEFKIWLAGVDNESRGNGIWSKLYQDIVIHAKKSGHQYILINTFPEKYPIMFSFLQKINANVYKEENVEGFKKVYARVSI